MLDKIIQNIRYDTCCKLRIPLVIQSVPILIESIPMFIVCIHILIRSIPILNQNIPILIKIQMYLDIFFSFVYSH